MTSFQSYTADAGQTLFAIPFRYIQQSFVKVDVDGTELGLDTDFTITGSSLNDGIFDGGSIQLVNPAVGGETVKVFRDSGIDDASRLVDFEAGARLKASDLDKSAIQLLHLIQEVKDNSATLTDMAINIEDVIGLQAALDGKASTALFSTATPGLAPRPSTAAAANKYVLCADGTWVANTGGGGTGGAGSFLALSDTPTEYTGQGGKFVRVATDPNDGLEFAASATSLNDLTDVSLGQAAPSTGDSLVFDGQLGSSGAFTLSPTLKVDHTPNTLYQAGSILVVDGTGNYAPLDVPASSDGKVLTINSAAASGQQLEWATGGGGGGGIAGYFYAQGPAADVTYQDGGNVSWGTPSTNVGGVFTLIDCRTGIITPTYTHATLITDAGLQVSAAGDYKVTAVYGIKNIHATQSVRVVFSMMKKPTGASVFTNQEPRCEITLDPGISAMVQIDVLAALGAGDQLTFQMVGTDPATGGWREDQIEIQANRSSLTALALS